MKIIVSCQPKERRKLTGITVEEEAVVTVVLRVAELSRKHWFFSGAFSSGAAIRPLWCGCPGFPKYLKKPA